MLGAFADLAATPSRREDLSADPDKAAWADAPLTAFTGDERVEARVLRSDGDRLQAMARVRGDTISPRLGFLWLYAPGQYVGPLVSVAVRLRRGRAGDCFQLDVEEEPELWDPALPSGARDDWLRRVERHVTVPTEARRADLHDLASAFAAAAGGDDVGVLDPDRPLHEWRRRSVSTRCALYLREVKSATVSTATTYRTWQTRDLRGTALEALYERADDVRRTSGEAPPDFLTPMPLDDAQCAALLAADSGAPISVVSGPPGTGKSQTVAAMVLHAIARGERVLVAAPSDAAIAAVRSLISRSGVSAPIVVGGGRAERTQLADRLGWGAGAQRDERESAATVSGAMGRYRALRAAVEEQLAVEAASAPSAEIDELVARYDAPGFFEPDADHAQLDELLRRATGPTRWWWQRRRARRAADALRSTGRASGEVGPDRLATALTVARRMSAAAVSRAAGGLSLDHVWPSLSDAEAAARTASAAWLDWRSTNSRHRRAGAQAVSVVAAALRSGRTRRRELLGSVPGRTLTDALPIWVATLRDIEDLLPPTPAMFDLVIIDEAAQVDQPTASVALARASRAVIVGDPQQLRHVSFLADDRVRDVLAAHNLTGDPLLAGRLDLRRMTVFDAATGVAPVQMLDTHYRSAPHLIGFSARRFYDGRLTVATAHPGNDRADHIDVVALPGHRAADGINTAEVDWIVAHLRARVADGATSVGVVTPFRAHADAIARAVTDAFGLDELDRLDLRIGTVHGFQGCERDEIVISLGASEPDQLGFVNDRNLFNVMVTRARHRVTLLSSLGDRGTGLVAEYLRYADGSAGAVSPSRRPKGWVAEVHQELRRLGSPPSPTIRSVATKSISSSATGRRRSPSSARSTRRAGSACRATARGDPAGWVGRDCFASRWQTRLAEAAVQLSVSTRDGSNL